VATIDGVFLSLSLLSPDIMFLQEGVIVVLRKWLWFKDAACDPFFENHAFHRQYFSAKLRLADDFFYLGLQKGAYEFDIL
jgi:hypothetical protein